MFVTYNPNGIGDVLVISLQSESKSELKTKSHGPITKISNQENYILGYNIFSASSYLTIENTGQFLLTEPLLDQIRSLFKKYDLDDVLDFDLSAKFVIGYVQEKTQHENADKLSVCQVDTGEETLQIVCGAANVDVDQKIVVAKVGATMPSGLEIKPTELRGIPSNGMICSKKELGLPQPSNEKGIYVLDNDYTIGDPFIF